MKSALRLRRSTDFAHVRRQGKLYRHSSLLLTFVENDLSYNRYGFVTSKKLGNAVVRNRTKRRLREATYQLHPRLVQGYDIVVVARPAVVEQPFLRLLRILERLYHQTRLIRDK
jgi:ribonuclease P protein component